MKDLIYASHSLCQAPLPENTAQQMSVALSAAIQAGNVKKAQDVALLLAQSHTPVSVNFDAAMRERKAREKEIRSAVNRQPWPVLDTPSKAWLQFFLCHVCQLGLNGCMLCVGVRKEHTQVQMKSVGSDSFYFICQFDW